jgi:hypothetical protein
MATGRIVLNATAPDLPAAKNSVGRMPFRMDRAALEATREATSLLGNMAQDSIEDIAGGVYWNVVGTVRPTPRGGVGRVVTGPNRPHVITPRPENRRRVLSWRTPEGNWVSARRVNHPGANPVYWPRGLGSFAERAERIFEREVEAALNGD